MKRKIEGNGHNPRNLTPEQLKSIAELTLQNDERIEQLWDMVVELKLLASKAGWAIPDAKVWQDVFQERAASCEALKNARQRLRESLGLG